MKIEFLEHLILTASFAGRGAEDIAKDWNLPAQSIRRIRDIAYERYRTNRGLDEVVIEWIKQNAKA